jgi:hypothetical protein
MHPDQMSPLDPLIHKAISSVKQSQIIHEMDVTRLRRNFEPMLFGDRVEEIEGFALTRGERGH